MANSTNNIQFKITSAFAGEGFTKANNAAKDLAGEAGKAAAAANKIGNALGNLNGPAGKTAQAIQGVVGALKAFGLAGAIVAAGEIAITAACNKVKQKYDDLLKSVTAANEKMKEKLGAAVAAELGKVSAAIQQIGDKTEADIRSLNRMEAAAKKVSAAMGKGESAEAAANVVNIELERLNQRIQEQREAAGRLKEAEDAVAQAYIAYNAANTLGEQRDAEKKLKAASEALEAARRQNAVDEAAINLADAEAKLKALIEEQSGALAERTRAVNDARTAEETAKARLEQAESNRVNASEGLTTAQETLARLENAGVDDEKALSQARNDVKTAEKIVKKREEELEDATTNLKVARQETLTAETELKTVSSQYSGRVEEAKYSVEQLKSNYDKLKENVAIANETQKQLSEAESKFADSLQGLQASRETAEAKRLNILEQLKDAEEKSAEWELKAGEAAQKKYSMMERLQLDEWLKHGEKCLTDQQKQQCADYKDWLYHLGDNPFKNIIDELNIDLTAIDAELKNKVENVATYTKDASNEITRMREILNGLGLK